MAAEDWIEWDTWDDFDYEGPPPPDKKIKYKSIIARTKKAIMFEDDNGSFWLPKSVIKVNRLRKTVVIEEWFIEKFHYMELNPPPYFDPREVREDIKQSKTDK